jgi:two-component system, NtrC family, sensor kinase
MISEHTDNHRILVVDDNESIHQDFRSILAPADRTAALAAAEAALFGEDPVLSNQRFEIDSAYQGQEALKLLNQALDEGRPYAMAFVDMRMPPGWDGVETIGHLWARDPHLQIAVCTAFADYSWQQMSQRLQLRDRLLILKKPFDIIEIRQLANALTAKWQMERDATLRLRDLEDAVAKRTQHLRRANEALQKAIIERERLEAQLLLKQKLECIERLAAGVTHEVNAPIQFICDSVEFLRAAFEALESARLQYRHALTLACDGKADAPALELARAADAAADLTYLQVEIPRAFDRTLEGIRHVAYTVRTMKDLAQSKAGEQGAVDADHALASTLTVARGKY